MSNMPKWKRYTGRRKSRSPGQPAVAVLLALAVALVAAQLTSADFLKLSAPMPSFGDVEDFQISPDGRYAIYRADQDTDEVFDLYSVPLSGGTPVRLNGPLPSGSEVDNFYRISPDSSRVVYSAPQDRTGVMELYSVPIQGPAGASVKLNGPLVDGGDVQRGFSISADSSRVVYRADQEIDNVIELYSVPLEGPASEGVKLSEPLVTGGYLAGFRISLDSSRVVYRADQETDDVIELYSVPLVGPAGEGIKLNGPLVDGGDVSVDYQISPDSNWVVYSADQQTDGIRELYSVFLEGPASAGVKLNRPLVGGGSVNDFEISPDSGRVAYIADQDTNEMRELYSVPIAGPASAGVKLNGAMVTGGNVYEMLLSPDSSRAVYAADQQTNGTIELYSVPLKGPASAGVKLNKTLPEDGWVELYRTRISPDSSRAVYVASQDTKLINEVYSVPLEGPAGEGLKLNAPLQTGQEVHGHCPISPDSNRVLYRAFLATATTAELYSVPLVGPSSSSLKLNGPLVTGGWVMSWVFSPDSSRVVYTAEQDNVDVVELYVADDGQTEVGFDAATVTIAEDAGSAFLSVALNQAAIFSVTVAYSVTGGTAIGGGVDYTLNDGQLTFPPGETEGTIEVLISADTLPEEDETIVVTLGEPHNATLGATIELTLTIEDRGAQYRVYLPVVVSDH